MTYNEKLQYFLKSKNMTKKKMAEMLQVNETMLGRYMSGEANFTQAFLIKLMAVFPDADLNYIFSEDGNKNLDMVAEPTEDLPKIQKVLSGITLLQKQLDELKQSIEKNL
jgi:transcriptional regulator with XRE-family HTH domain